MCADIQLAETPGQFDAAGQLVRAYAQCLGLDLEFQGFSDELNSLSSLYGPPRGALFLAERHGEPVGVVGLRELGAGVAEMKRMYVLEQHRGAGIGQALTRAVLTHAQELGYRAVRLDSIRELESALRLYRDFGFREIAPYRFNPYPGAVFMEYTIS